MGHGVLEWFLGGLAAIAGCRMPEFSDYGEELRQ
jgi:hypothetical protein